LTYQANSVARAVIGVIAKMLIAQKVVPQRWNVSQRLKDTVHEARIA
jgi:hypothetical protein